MAPFDVGSRDPYRREGGGLVDCDLLLLAQLEQREEGDGLFDTGTACNFRVEVEEAPSLQQRAEALDEERDGREPKCHVRERDLRRLRGECTQCGRELRRILL